MASSPSTWAANASNNISKSFSSLSAQDYIRLVIIVGSYCLLRPYIVKLGAKLQTKEHEKEIEPGELLAPGSKAKGQARVSPNSLREQVQVPEDTDEEDEDDEDGDGQGGREGAGVDWGKNARRKQRRMIRQLLEADEKKRAAELDHEDDKDIEEFLVD